MRITYLQPAFKIIFRADLLSCCVVDEGINAALENRNTTCIGHLSGNLKISMAISCVECCDGSLM